MSTYRELVYMILDELKLTSDDSHFQKEHIIFLLDKYRSAILKQVYEKQKQEIPESNYQTICVNLEKVNAFKEDTCSDNGYLKSIEEVPDTMSIGDVKVSTVDFFQGNITYVNRERFKYVGNNKYLKNFIYSTIAPDSHVYLKSTNPQSYYLNKVKVTGIFEDSSKAAELESCDGENSSDGNCDVLDKNYPLEEGLISQVIQLVVKELSTSIYKPKDSENNAFDDLSKLYTFIRNNMKSEMLKQIDG